MYASLFFYCLPVIISFTFQLSKHLLLHPPSSFIFNSLQQHCECSDLNRLHWKFKRVRVCLDTSSPAQQEKAETLLARLPLKSSKRVVKLSCTIKGRKAQKIKVICFGYSCGTDVKMYRKYLFYTYFSLKLYWEHLKFPIICGRKFANGKKYWAFCCFCSSN